MLKTSFDSGRVIILWLPVVLWMAFIFWMSTDTFSSDNTSSLIEPVLHFFAPGISPQGVDLVHGVTRKMGHVVEYFVLGLLLARALRAGGRPLAARRWALRALIIVFLWAALDELHQSLVPTRGASILDVALDTLAGGLAQLARLFWDRHRSG